MRRPLVGVTLDTGRTLARPGRPSLPLVELKTAYADAVREAGGIPLLLAPGADAAEVTALLATLDALVVTGGAFDIPPEAYGAAARPGLVTKPARTGFETALLLGALDADKPLLGVCGGMQLLAVALGGTLWQDVASDVPGALAHEQPNDPREPGHDVAITPGTRLESVVKSHALGVNSTHHQAVRDVPSALVVSARAPDGIVEAVELAGERFALGVEWHPELLGGVHLELYRALVEACG